MKTYKRLNQDEREKIMVLRSQRYSQTEIAEELNRDASTISRELKRHSGPQRAYSAHSAQEEADRRARCHNTQRKLSKPRLWRIVKKKLKLRWSPEQISRCLRKRYPEDPTMHVSHEAIYSFLYVQTKGTLKKELTSCLRQKRTQRRSRTGRVERRGKIPDMISIDQRPAEVASRTVPGHWEGDLVMGAMNRSAIGTLVERMTRFLIVVILTAHDATSTRFAFRREIMRLPAHLRWSMTYDQGKEMSEHVKLTMDTKMQVYFAHPHSPWMRGTNENTNGLIRDFFPKGTDFSQVSERELRKVQHMLNERPRKTLGWKTPKEAMHELLVQAART
jgi:transposase, IS30 family